MKSFEEWDANPSWHADYSDYVRHMKNEERLEMERLVKKAVKEALKEKKDEQGI